MPPKNPKPIRPKLRGETWELHDGRRVTLLNLLGVTKTDAGKVRIHEVLNDRGALESIYDSEFKRRIEPPVEKNL